MFVRRYLNVFSGSALQLVTDIVSPYSTREWHFHRSKPDDTNHFFASFLTLDEVAPLMLELDKYFWEISPNTPLRLDRAYANCHPEGVPGTWHQDAKNELAITAMYYPPTEHDFGWGGGTEFKDHGLEKYIPNSMVVFPGCIWHRALEHNVRQAYRFGIAFKTYPCKDGYS